MTISYVMDDGARRADKNAWPTADQAIEHALEAARKLQRAVSVWEWDSERKGEWPQVPSARLHYCLVFPDGSTQKSAKGQNPFKVHMDEHADSGSDGGDSIEKTLGLPTITLGNAVGQIDAVMQEMAGKIDEEAMNQLHRIGDRAASAAVRRVERSRRVLGSFKRGYVYQIGGQHLGVAGVDPKSGTVRMFDRQGTFFNVDALTLARELVRADEMPAEQPAEAHHLSPGDVAIVDEKNKAFVLDSAEEVYVVLQEGQIETVPDDVTRIRLASDAGDPEAKKLRRVWQAFFRSLLKFFDVASVDEMDSEQKSRMFDMARRKWPKVQKQMMVPNKPGTVPQKPGEEQQPAAPGEEEQQPEASAAPAVAHDPDEDYNRPEYDEEPEDIQEAIDDTIRDNVEAFLESAKVRIGFEVGRNGREHFVQFEPYGLGQEISTLKAAIEKDISAGKKIFSSVREESSDKDTVDEAVVLTCSLSPAFISAAETEAREAIQYGRDIDETERSLWNASWSNGPTLLSYCMDLLGNDVEAAAKLAMSFMAASLRDATKLRAMKSMKKFEGHELKANWFDAAMLLTEAAKRSNVKAGKAIDLTPPKDVQKIAARALDRANKEGIQLPSITMQQAKLLVAGKAISLEAAERMHLFLTRHQLTAKSELLWDAWGGHAGKRWVVQLAKMINPVQAGVTKKKWKDLFQMHLAKLVSAEFKDTDFPWKISVSKDGSVIAEASDERLLTLFCQDAAKKGMKTSPVTTTSVRIGGIDRLYYEANKAYHKELGVPWTAQLEKVWQHRLASENA